MKGSRNRGRGSRGSCWRGCRGGCRRGGGERGSGGEGDGGILCGFLLPFCSSFCLSFRIRKKWFFLLGLKLSSFMLKIKDSLNGIIEINFETFFVFSYNLIKIDIIE
jgi:hypothetical protein